MLKKWWSTLAVLLVTLCCALNVTAGSVETKDGKTIIYDPQSNEKFESLYDTGTIASAKFARLDNLEPNYKEMKRFME